MTSDEFYEKMGIGKPVEKPEEPKRRGRPSAEKQTETTETEPTVETES